MATFPETRESLLALLGDAGACDAWEHLAGIYRPVISDAAPIAAFLAEVLTPSDEQRLTEHIDACALCQQKMESMAADPEVWLEVPFLPTPNSCVLETELPHFSN